MRVWEVEEEKKTFKFEFTYVFAVSIDTVSLTKPFKLKLHPNAVKTLFHSKSIVVVTEPKFIKLPYHPSTWAWSEVIQYKNHMLLKVI